MPKYDYECNKCGKIFEVSQSMMDDTLTDCLDEACGEKGALKRLISGGGGVIFKGSGFYQTDYKNKGNASSSTEGKSETPPCASSCSASTDGKCPMAS